MAVMLTGQAGHCFHANRCSRQFALSDHLETSFWCPRTLLKVLKSTRHSERTTIVFATTVAFCTGCRMSCRNLAHRKKVRTVLCVASLLNQAALDEAEEELPFQDLENTDPGRSAFRAEWAIPGDILFQEDSAASGLVRVYSTIASQGGFWQRLRFNDQTEQSIVLLDANRIPVRAALPFGYLKSLAAVSLCTARALGCSSPLRVLMIGTGGGALPAWFSEEQGAVVDAVELDMAVLRAGIKAMGLPPSSLQPVSGAKACVRDASTAVRSCETRLRVYCCDGANFVMAAAAAGIEKYDIIIVDVFDGKGSTPPAFVSEEFGKALGSITSCAVANLACPVNMWDEAHEFNAPEAAALVKSWRTGFGPNAGVWSVRVAEGQNIIPAVTHVGIPPAEFLEKEANAAAEDGTFAFDPLRRVSFRRRDWL